MCTPLGKVSGVSVVGLGVEILGDLASLLHLRRARGKFEQRDAAVGADHAEAAVLRKQCRLPPASSSIAAMRLPFSSITSIAFDDGGAGGHRRTRADRGVAGDLPRRIAVLVGDFVAPECRAVRRTSRVKHRGVALAGRLHVEIDGQRAVAGEGEPGALERRAAGMLEHAGNADAAIFAARFALAPARS